MNKCNNGRDFLFWIASLIVPTRTPGSSSPIFLEELDCTPTDTDILQCNAFSARGLHSCSHSQDVSVRCTGKIITTC